MHCTIIFTNKKNFLFYSTIDSGKYLGIVIDIYVKSTKPDIDELYHKLNSSLYVVRRIYQHFNSILLFEFQPDIFSDSLGRYNSYEPPKKKINITSTYGMLFYEFTFV